MIVKNAKFELTAVKPEQYPDIGIPEVAFVGRSNVGKSSIINTLCNRRNLARVGSTPGVTKEINFYNIDDKLHIVDLPGYGYAGVSKGKKSSWSRVIETYLNTREELKLIIMLVDIRHSPSNEDKMMYGWLIENEVPHIVVATKVDKISRSQVQGRLADIKQTLELSEGIKLIPYSSETKQGRDEVWGEIDSMVVGEEG
ncbi:MAG: ribosome biogenesis GTP-binding protein YihA/YsxC [Clostridia bacterium]|nr:ribosome biogenesis GTP-binding protein YihA/YsxC [Clostridia bacterium]